MFRFITSIMILSIMIATTGCLYNEGRATASQGAATTFKDLDITGYVAQHRAGDQALLELQKETMLESRIRERDLKLASIIAQSKKSSNPEARKAEMLLGWIQADLGKNPDTALREADYMAAKELVATRRERYVDTKNGNPAFSNWPDLPKEDEKIPNINHWKRADNAADVMMWKTMSAYQASITKLLELGKPPTTLKLLPDAYFELAKVPASAKEAVADRNKKGTTFSADRYKEYLAALTELVKSLEQGDDSEDASKRSISTDLKHFSAISTEFLTLAETIDKNELVAVAKLEKAYRAEQLSRMKSRNAMVAQRIKLRAEYQKIKVEKNAYLAQIRDRVLFDQSQESLGEKAKADLLEHSLLEYLDTIQVYQVELDRIYLDLLSSVHDETLAASESILKSWYILILSPMETLAAYHKAGIKSEQIAHLAAALSLPAIAIGQND